METQRSHVLPPDAVNALRQGNKIEAIKIVRETLGMGLKEAKDLVEGASIAPQQASDAPTRSRDLGSRQLPPAAISALRQGNKIEAIRLVREHLRIGLKEAKDIVDDASDARQADASASPVMHGEPRGIGKGWLLLLLVLIVAGVYYWWR